MIVGTTDWLRGARVASGPDDGDGAAIHPNEASDGPKYDAQEAKKTVERLVILVMNRVAALNGASIALVDGRIDTGNYAGDRKNG